MSLTVSVPVTWLEVIFRISIAFGMGVLFGLERQFNKKPVGFGPFAFVATGAAAMTIVAMAVNENPLPVFGAIITGIGFLGAGAIIKSSEKRVTGITTAASLWVFAAIGVVVGVGLFIEALYLFFLVGLVVLVDHFFERHGFGSYSKTVTLTVNDLSRVRDIEKMLPNHRTYSYVFDNKTKEYTLTCTLSGNKREVNMTLNELVKQPNVLVVRVD